jgi:hypothetical protein
MMVATIVEQMIIAAARDFDGRWMSRQYMHSFRTWLDEMHAAGAPAAARKLYSRGHWT